MFGKKLWALLLVLVLIMTACAPAPECPPCPEPVCPECPECPLCPDVPAVTGSLFDTVKARGKVICGGRTDLLGFGYLDANGRNVGMDIDLCRAVAVALFNDTEAVEFVHLTAAERGPALQTGEIDMLSRNCTWRSEERRVGKECRL